MNLHNYMLDADSAICIEAYPKGGRSEYDLPPRIKWICHFGYHTEDNPNPDVEAIEGLGETPEQAVRDFGKRLKEAFYPNPFNDGRFE